MAGALVGLLIAAQIASPSGSLEAVKLNVFAPPVHPKAPVYLNVAIENPAGAALRELRQTLTFQRTELRFIRARLGIAGELAGAKLTVTLLDAKGTSIDEKNKDAAEGVDISVAAAADIPPGPLVEIQFKPVEAKEQKITVRQTAELRDNAGKPVPGLQYSDVEIVVSKTLAPEPLAIFTCYFYMH